MSERASERASECVCVRDVQKHSFSPPAVLITSAQLISSVNLSYTAIVFLTDEFQSAQVRCRSALVSEIPF